MSFRSADDAAVNFAAEVNQRHGKGSTSWDVNARLTPQRTAARYSAIITLCPGPTAVNPWTSNYPKETLAASPDVLAVTEKLNRHSVNELIILVTKENLGFKPFTLWCEIFCTRLSSAAIAKYLDIQETADEKLRLADTKASMK
ncbi:hypothetical protein KOW79_013272 [Hemibagrus wyckioides]|uniref:Uncharacterized protein n=1 Tax=Hemibagrus wyckioides TaxID=337641 RepID=A0A9D3SH16_9TELE|nr:hypothetical protein KOW79_013272 [Hemibagrus wyckioides]